MTRTRTITDHRRPATNRGHHTPRAHGSRGGQPIHTHNSTQTAAPRCVPSPPHSGSLGQKRSGAPAPAPHGVGPNLAHSARSPHVSTLGLTLHSQPARTSTRDLRPTPPVSARRP